MRVSRRVKKLFLSLSLLFSCVFIVGCGGGAGVPYSTLKFEIRDESTKAGIDGAVVMIQANDPGGNDLAHMIKRQLVTDGRGKVTFTDCPPDRSYTVSVQKDNYTVRVPNPNDAAITNQILSTGFIAEQGNTYEFIIYMSRNDMPSTGTVKGYVRNALTGDLITTATVYINDSNKLVSDTTDKPSNPGYYELNNVSTSQPQNMNVTAAGYQTVTQLVTVPPGASVRVDFALVTGSGTISGWVQPIAGETLPAGTNLYVGVYKNGTDIIASATVPVAAGGAATYYQVQNVPVIPPESTMTYTVKVTSDYCYMSNPAQGISGLVIRTQGQNVTAGNIQMTCYKGTILLTLVHPDTFDITETETQIETAAANAIIGVENTTVVGRYTGESPNHYFHYTLSEVPAGDQKLVVHFPNHQLANDLTVKVLRDQSVSLIATLREAR